MLSLLEMMFPDWLREKLGLKEIFTVWTIFGRRDRDCVPKSRVWPRNNESDTEHCHGKTKACRHVCETCLLKGLDGNFMFEDCSRGRPGRSSSHESFDSPSREQPQLDRSDYGEMHDHVYPEYPPAACNPPAESRPLVCKSSPKNNDGRRKSARNERMIVAAAVEAHKEGPRMSDGDGLHGPASRGFAAVEPAAFKHMHSEVQSVPPPLPEQPAARKHKRAMSLFESFGSSMPYDGMADSPTGNSNVLPVCNVFGAGPMQALSPGPAGRVRNAIADDPNNKSQMMPGSPDWQQELFKNKEDLSPFIALMSAAQSFTGNSRKTATSRSGSAQELRSISASDMRKIRSNYMKADSSFIPGRSRRRARSCLRKPSRRQQRNIMSFEELQMNVLANVRFEEKFRAFAKFGSRETTGITISCGNHLNWLRQAGICHDEFTEMVSQFAFKEACGAKTVISIHEYKGMLKQLSKLLSVDYFYMLRKLTSCGDVMEN